jgi:tRNA-Thr(GGU) m(6)t(6)A37 methyltransferase TsaA
MEISYRSIGTIRSPFEDIAGMPIQPSGAKGVEGTIEIFPEFADGLQDLEGFSHIILIFHFHKVTASNLQVTPFLDTTKRGVLATRSPKRPNPIGLSIVKLNHRADNILYVENIDILDGTPLLDIKPYVPEFDEQTVERLGWLEDAKGKVKHKRSDDRFR